MEQKTALGILKAGRNVFLTGSAGTGKTFLLNKYITYLRERGIEPAIVAPTGIAASHLDGTTIHSFFGIGINEEVDDGYIDSLFYRKYLHNRFKNLQVLIVDEVSMVSPALFESMDKILRRFKYSQQPFGGIQIVLAGDFFQLPPVSSSGQARRFAWQTELWQKSSLRVCYLEEKFRQDDLSLINILDEIRSGEVSDGSREIFEECYQKELPVDFKVTKLYTHNIDVDRINQSELDKLPGEEEIFLAQTKGAKKQLEKIFNSSLVTPELILKDGATVIFIKNNFEKGYTNGTLGKVVGFTDGLRLPIVEIFSGRRITVEMDDWTVENDRGEITASVRQMPLRLAWAITIHKSQGMTLDAAEIDLSRTFEVGQGYVALSRIKSIQGLRLMGMNEVALQVDEAVLAVDSKIKSLSNLNVRKWNSFSKEEQQKMMDDFITQIGGTIDEEEIKNHRKNLEIAEKEKREFLEGKNSNSKFAVKRGGYSSERGGTLKITKGFIEQGKTLAEIAKERKISERTIQDHLTKIMEKWPETNIEYLKPDDKLIKLVNEAVQAIKKKNKQDDFMQSGDIKLRPIFDFLNEEISYEDIKLALLFIEK